MPVWRDGVEAGLTGSGRGFDLPRIDPYDLLSHNGLVTERLRTIADVKAHFAECIREAESGRTIVVSRHGRPVAQLGPVRAASGSGERHRADEGAEMTSSYAGEESVAPPTPTARRVALRALLEQEVWPRIPERLLGKGVTKEEREEILGYTPSTGVSSKDEPSGHR